MLVMLLVLLLSCLISSCIRTTKECVTVDKLSKQGYVIILKEKLVDLMEAGVNCKFELMICNEEKKK